MTEQDADFEKNWPDLYRKVGQNGGLTPPRRKRLMIGLMPEGEEGKFSLEIVGTKFIKHYAADPDASNGAGTLLRITKGIHFRGDLTAVTPLDVMEHCVLQPLILNQLPANRRFIILN